MKKQELKDLRNFVSSTKKRKEELASGSYNEIGRLNLVAMTGEYAFRLIDLLDNLLLDAELGEMLNKGAIKGGDNA